MHTFSYIHTHNRPPPPPPHPLPTHTHTHTYTHTLTHSLTHTHAHTFGERGRETETDIQTDRQREGNAHLFTAGSIDDRVTKLEFTEASFRLTKDAATDSDDVKYKGIKNLSENDKSKLFILYGGNFVKGQVPEDWTHSYLKSHPKQSEDLCKLDKYFILTMRTQLNI